MGLPPRRARRSACVLGLRPPRAGAHLNPAFRGLGGATAPFGYLDAAPRRGSVAMIARGRAARCSATGLRSRCERPVNRLCRRQPVLCMDIMSEPTQPPPRRVHQQPFPRGELVRRLLLRRHQPTVVRHHAFVRRLRAMHSIARGPTRWRNHVGQRVWTQAVLRWLRNRDLIDDTRLSRASAELQARRYSGTFVNTEVLVQAAKLADWRLAHPMFERNLHVLGHATTELRVSGALAVALICACMTDVRLAPTQTLVVSAILERLRGRDRSLGIIHHVLRAIPVAMRLNPIGARRAAEIVATWLQTSSGLIFRGLLST